MKAATIITALLLTCFATAKAQTSVNFRNATDYTIYFAYCSYEGDYNGWTSRGWYEVGPWDNLTLNLGNYHGALYVYGENDLGTIYGGNTWLCYTDYYAFTHNQADRKYCPEQAPFHFAFKCIGPGNHTYTFY